MNIVYFIDHLRPDGAQFILRQLVEGLGRRGHRQMVICLNDSWDQHLVNALKDAGAEVEIIGKPALLTGYGFYKIWQCLKKDSFDAVVTILFVADVIGKVMARMAGLPKIVSNVQTRDEFYSPMQRWLVRRTMPFTDLVVLPSNNFRDFVIREEGAPQHKLITIYNFVPVENYQDPVSKDKFSGELGLPAEMFLIGCAGRLTHQKGHDVFLKALSMIDRGDYHVFMAGVGEEEGKLKAIADELGISNKIHWAGYRRDLPQILGALDLFVQPSRFEGMPLAVLEAMAAGCPIVLSAVDGNRELVEDGVSGWLVSPDDPESLASAIESALSDSDERKRRALLGKQRVIDKFSLNIILDQWEKVMANDHD